LLVVAMALYGVGDTFRSGTHKAMILTWLRLQGRDKERTAVYGVTRSWSKIGSAIGVLGGAAWVLWREDLDELFVLALIPYIVNLVNLATYPAALEGDKAGTLSLGAAWRHVWASLGEVVRSRPLR